MLNRVGGWLRAARNGESFVAAYVPAEQVIVDAPSPLVAAAFEATRVEDWATVGQVFAHTRQERAWDERSHLFTCYTQALVTSPQTLQEWMRADPDNPDLAVLTADFAVVRAWEARSGQRAEHVSRQQFDDFFEILGDAVALIRRAIEISPEDPEPLRVAITHARGSQQPLQTLHDLLDRLAEVAPHHRGAHMQALQYLCEKWFGSQQQMWAYARSVVEQAPPDASVQDLMVLATFEDLVEDQSPPAALVDEALDRARTYLASQPQAPAHLTAPTRNLIAAVCHFGDRPLDAYEEMLRIGAHATSFPWEYYASDAKPDGVRAAFLEFREIVAYRRAALPKPRTS